MGYFNKKRFSLKQVVVMLTITFAGIAVLSSAAVTIPHVFSPGNTISSSEMNENFAALAARPIAPTVATTTFTTPKSITNSPSTSLKFCEVDYTPSQTMTVTLLVDAAFSVQGPASAVKVSARPVYDSGISTYTIVAPSYATSSSGSYVTLSMTGSMPFSLSAGTTYKFYVDAWADTAFTANDGSCTMRVLMF
ncbi:MAG TPA: hypothetical protein VK654_15215 [Nitrospirota bacterium]|nr:hypothetical protein [Nitrospirota bacterium]